ncbi:MAG TPA: hypothetical protein VM366_17795 [Anaerolineae bacterium]|nr:hypothetical protein [Anaerolineae bacterium]
MVAISAADNIDCIQLQEQVSAPAAADATHAKIFAYADGLATRHAGNALYVNSQVASVDWYEIINLPIATGGGTADIAAFLGAPSINLDTDGETFLASVKIPDNWDYSSDLQLVLMVANEIAETDGDDVSITCQIRGYADGDTMSAAGQAVAIAQNLTGGDEAINVVNECTGTIDYNHGTYDIAQLDTMVIECIVNLAGGGECTGPLHVISWWVRYKADHLGEATI